MVDKTPFLTAVLYTGVAYVPGSCLWFTAGLKWHRVLEGARYYQLIVLSSVCLASWRGAREIKKLNIFRQIFGIDPLVPAIKLSIFGRIDGA